MDSPFILLAAALSWGLTLSSLISVWHSIPDLSAGGKGTGCRTAVAGNLPVWICSAFFRGTGIPGNYLWEIQRGIRRACCHGIFRRGFSAFTTGTWCRGYMLPAWHHLAWVTERSGTFGSVIFHGIGNLAFFSLSMWPGWGYPCAAACMRGAAGNFRCLLLVSGLPGMLPPDPFFYLFQKKRRGPTPVPPAQRKGYRSAAPSHRCDHNKWSTDNSPVLHHIPYASHSWQNAACTVPENSVPPLIRRRTGSSAADRTEAVIPPYGRDRFPKKGGSL